MKLEAKQQFIALLWAFLCMPKGLTLANKALDVTVDRLYRKTPFKKDEAERVTFLFEMYKKITRKDKT